MEMNEQSIVVFGGNGFIGSHFVDYLIKCGYDVTVVDRFTAEKDNCSLASSQKIHRIKCDIDDSDAYSSALGSNTVVYNFISAFNPRSSWGRAIESVQADVIQALRLCELCIKRGVAKFVYVSSGGTIYGPQSGIVTEDRLPRPFNPHGICKLTVEHFLEYYRVKEGIPIDIYRVGNVFGPRQPMRSAQGVVAVWMRQILDQETIEVYGDSETCRDYIYVGDAAYLLGHSLRDFGSSDVYNLGTGKGVSIIELLDIFKEVVDIPFQSRIHPRRSSDNTRSILSGEKLCRHYPDLNFKDMKAMIKHTWEHVKNEHRHDR